MNLLILARLLLLLLAPSSVSAEKRPHIVLVLADDLGYANVGFNRVDQPVPKEVQTPHLDSLVKRGILLRRHYSFKICSPSRSALQTGRLAVHVNVHNVAPEVHNEKDPISGFQGIPRNMTGIAQKLKESGYRTAMTGKWDAGMATWDHTPMGRGYESFFGYFHHANDYWNCRLDLQATGEIDVCLNLFKDLWDNDGPAIHSCGTAYEEQLFTQRSLEVIGEHDPSVPLFLFHSFHLVHTPLQVPSEYLEKFAFVDNKERRHYAAMVYYMDEVVGKLEQALRGKGMWNDTVFIFLSDNGGPIYKAGSANNYPLRGGKFSDWEGGVRTVAFISGGALAENVRGTASDALVNIADWYSTIAELAKVDPTDHRAKLANLPPIDSQSQWTILTSGQSQHKDARQEMHLSQQALIRGRFKLIVGGQTMSSWTGPFYPNATGHEPLILPLDNKVIGDSWFHDCGNGCLFDIFADPTEHHDLAQEHPDIAASMYDRLQHLNKSLFEPDRGQPSKKACEQARRNGGFYGPFLE